MTTANDTGATSKQVREPTDQELTAEELERVSGGFFEAVLQIVRAPPKTGPRPVPIPYPNVG
jgi:hypothetical protein